MAYIGIQPAEKFTSFATQEFSTSATTSYTLDHAVANENEIALFVNNVRQQPGSGKAYTATGTALTLSAATASTDTMYCVFLGRALQTVTPATNSITTSMININGGELFLDADADTSITADTDDQIDFKTGGTDRLKIDSTDVTVSTGNIVFGTASKGVYLGVTSATAANLLDDYEEGTWTPVYKGGSTAGSSPSGGGTYTKIGNLVHVDFSLVNIASTGASGDAIVAGLPFVCNQTNNTRGSFGGSVRFYNHELTGTSRYLINTFIDNGNSHIAFIQSGDATPWTSVAVDNDSGMYIEGAITYRTDA